MTPCGGLFVTGRIHAHDPNPSFFSLIMNVAHACKSGHCAGAVRALQLIQASDSRPRV
ncbi:hypothetical protein MES4922_110322 [Mesorhizobium ventifaucium]|uniref:Uncharacterized protein n=1 Tax=Mesorhizobium ventifaucium TaxID=666020 RepID=A0ABM9DF32_9HYPH|nr:hypothetical protein MES4922_110322 [Mesorhizobium ventifaucium]